MGPERRFLHVSRKLGQEAALWKLDLLEEVTGSGDECTQVSLHARFKEDGRPDMVTRWDIVFELLDGFEDKPRVSLNA